MIMDGLQHSGLTRFRVMAREASRRVAVCGLGGLVVLMAGCDPCMNNPCDDGLGCNGLETCSADGSTFVCTDGTPVACEFPTFCTEPDTACVDPCDGADCSDSNECTTDTCTTNADGTTTCTNDTACDDADPCTEGDVCSVDEVCVGTAIECTAGEVCADGVCVCTDDSVCNDGDPCNGVETCDVETGDCVAGIAFCDDGFFCNGAEECTPNAETGALDCGPGTAPCDSATQTCDEATNECLTNCIVNADCDDLIACNGVESCGFTGTCVGGTEPDCDDGDPCTDDSCSEDGGCVSTAVVCGAGEVCDSATGVCGVATPEDVDVLQIGGFFYPTGLFFCGGADTGQDPTPECPVSGCDEAHWHGNGVTAIAAVAAGVIATDTTIDDPNPCTCGHGKVSAVTRTTISVSQDDLTIYFLETGLDALPAAGDCP